MKYILTFIMLFTVSIVEASTAPNWVLGRGHVMYDSAHYLMGVGYSEKNMIDAGESARAELIKSIRIKIDSKLKDYNSTEGVRTEYSLISETDFLLEGSQIKDGWYDEKNDVFYSLAVIKREYVINTLKEMISGIMSRNSLTMRQADTFYNNGDIIKSLVYYYDGYVESSKLFPLIQTYNHVIIDNNNSSDKNYNLLFKEKIQNIVEHINLEKITHSLTDTDVNFGVRATYKNRALRELPVKFFSVNRTYLHKVICNNECVTKTSIKSVLSKENKIYLKAKIDLKTFERFFSYDLNRHLFKRLDLLSVSLRDSVEIRKVEKPETKKRAIVKNFVTNESRNLSDVMQQELNGIRGMGMSRPRWTTGRPRGHINFRIGIGIR